MARKIPNQRKENIAHYRRIERYVYALDRVYQQATDEAAALALLTHHTGDTPFKWSDYPQTKARLDAIKRDFAKNIKGTIVNGVTAEWGEANFKNDRLANAVIGIKKFDVDKQGNEVIPKRFKQYFQNNDRALSQFISRRDKGGLDLSKRVWNLTENYTQGLETALATAIGKGTDAVTLSKRVSKYLHDYPTLRADYTEQFGTATNILDCEWRSARLARTEINMAYRSADQERWSQMDFVVGYEIKRSQIEYDCPVCSALTGKYPKDFVFLGWHPSCRCYVIPILKTDDEFWSWDGRGETPTSSVNEVKDVPQGFKNWVKDNSKRIEESKSLPYFLRDNSKLIPELYIANSKRFAGFVDSKVSNICTDLGVYSTPINLKSESRILQKARNDYKGNISEVRDIVRTTITCDSSKFDDVFAEINSRFNVVRHKIQNEVRSGYSGHIFNVKTSGATFAEIQVNTPQMIYGKEVGAKSILGDDVFNEIKRKSGLENGLGHKLYEAYRVLDKEVDIDKIKALEKQSRDYYNALSRIKL